MNRKTLFNQLTALVSGQFNQLLFEINPTSGLIPPTPATQAERVIAFLQWAESPSGCGLTKVQEVLKSILNPYGMDHPKSTSPIHNLPDRNRFFTGRVDVLNQLTDLIKSNKEVAIKQAISGMGGIGKTQTAIEFCYRQIANNNYQTILWIIAENQTSFNNSYYNVVDLLNLASNSSTSTDNSNVNEALKIDEVILLVKRWLANNHNWLMVLDNLEDPKLIKDYLPLNHQGHVLITSRSQSLKGYAAIVQLKKMSLETATLFLLKRANLIPIYASNLEQLKLDNNLADELIADAQNIVQAMDSLPLALEQAGAYIQETQCSLSDYLKSYEDTRNIATILDNDGEDANDHKSVYATFKLALNKVKEKSMVATKLLEICSFLDNDLIPEEIFTKAGNLLDGELAKLQDNNYEFNNCLKLLLNYSLIERDTNNKSLSIHRLVQTVIRDLLTEDNKKSLLDSLAKALYSLCPESAQIPNNWPTYQKLLPSVTSLFDFAKLYHSNSIKSAKIFHQFGLYCDKQALFTQSLTFYNLALDTYKYHFGDYHPSVADTLNNIGEVYRQQSNYSLALEFYNQALSIYKNRFGDFHPSVADTLNNIAIVCQAQGNYSLALDFYNQALSITKHHFGNNHYSIADTLNNIAIVCQAQGNYSLALDFYNQALSIRKHHFGNNHPSVAQTLNNIAVVYDSQSNYSQALDLHNQALSIRKHHFGNNHPSVADTLNNIANVYQAQGNFSPALDFYNQALNIKKHHLGNVHPSVADTLNNIGEVYRQQSNYSLALDFYNQALSIYKHPSDNSHPNTAITLENLGHLYKAINKQLEAIDYYKQALAIYDQVFPANHPWIAELLDTYSQLLLKLNKTDQAQPLLDRLASLQQSP